MELSDGDTKCPINVSHYLEIFGPMQMTAMVKIIITYSICHDPQQSTGRGQEHEGTVADIRYIAPP